MADGSYWKWVCQDKLDVVGIAASAAAPLISDVIQKDGTLLKEFVDHNEQERWQEAEIPEAYEIVVASFDGANVRLRESGTKRGRPQNGDTDKAENVIQARAYRNVIRGATLAYKGRELTDNTGESAWKPQRLRCYYLAALPEQGFGVFRDQSSAALEHLQSQFPKKGVIKLLLMDGARNLWNWAKGESSFEDFNWLLDFYHASEHLSVIGESLFAKQSEKVEPSRSRISLILGVAMLVPSLLATIINP